MKCLNEIAWGYYRRGRYDEARRCFERARTQDDFPVGNLSELMLTLANKMLVCGRLGLREQSEIAAREFVRRYGRIEYTGNKHNQHPQRTKRKPERSE